MKRTKNMIYKPTEESKELMVFTVNTEIIYPYIVNVVKSLAKKYAKGIYDSDKAVDAYYPIATKASEIYNKWFGYSFSVQDRFTAAVELQEYFYDNVVLNDL